MVFSDTNVKLRSGESFAAKEQPEHHNSSSPLQKLDIGQVTKFPYDPMHLVYLGVMRRLLYRWKGVCSSHLGFCQRPKISVKDRLLLSERLVSVQKIWPSDFNRKPRSLEELDFLKATELRQFLLYIGPNVLKDILTETYNDHFMCLFVAIHILNSKDYKEKNSCANTLLTSFVEMSASLYGKDFQVYNVHSLIHLPEDSLHLGPLHSFSAFAFENYMQTLKSMLKKPHYLQQVVKRTLEKQMWSQPDRSLEDPTLQFEVIDSSKCISPDLPDGGLKGIHYSSAKCHLFKLATNVKDSFVILKDHRIFQIFNIVKQSNDIYLVAKFFKKTKSFYDFPIQLSDINFFQVENLSKKIVVCNISAVAMEVVLLQHKDVFAVVPINHSRSLFPYCIVQFTIDQTVTVIPTGWLRNAQCWWPQESVKRHILFNSEPDVNSWSSFAFKVVHYSRTYATADVSITFFETITDIVLYSEDESQSLLTEPPSTKEKALLHTILEKVMQLSSEVKELKKLQPITSGQQSMENIDYLPLSSSEEMIQLNEDLEEANKFNKL
ncbi:hypothetical protein JTE90_027698, partial [Oedothorax gibbosus]